MRPLHIAVLDEELPFPLTSGKRIRTYNLLSRLAARHKITLISHQNDEPGETRLGIEAFRRLGIETLVVPRKIPKKSGARFYARLAGNLLSQLPYSVSTHTSSEIVQTVARFAELEPVDLWHCEWTPYAQVLRRALGNQLKRIPWIVMAHNVESLIWQRYVETEAEQLKRWYIRQQYKKFEKFERWAFSHATWTVAVSEEDAELIRHQCGGSEQTEVVENGVDTRYFKPQRDVDRLPDNILFLGALDWRPNQDAVDQLLTHIFPRVKKLVPTATLSIVGRNPPWALQQRIARQPGVILKGNVPDVRPYLAQATLMAVPLRIGGGSRLKIIEALAMATPVVSTTVGAEGLRFQPEEHFTLADTNEQMVQAIMTMFRDPLQAEDQAERGRQWAISHYDWNPLALKLEEIWQVAQEMVVGPSTQPG